MQGSDEAVDLRDIARSDGMGGKVFSGVRALLKRSNTLPSASRCLCQSTPTSLHSPDLQDEAVKTVSQKAELLCAEWTEAV